MYVFLVVSCCCSIIGQILRKRQPRLHQTIPHFHYTDFNSRCFYSRFKSTSSYIIVILEAMSLRLFCFAVQEEWNDNDAMKLRQCFSHIFYASEYSMPAKINIGGVSVLSLSRA